MADEFDNDDWLYGETNENIQQQPLPTTNNVPEQPPGTEETVCEENNQLPPPATGPGEGLEPEQQPSAEEQQLQPPGAEDEQATLQPPPTENETSEQNVEEKEDGELKQNGEEEEDQTDDSDDDEFNVVIDEPNANATTSSNYTPLNIKRGGLLTSTAPIDKSKQMVQQQQAGKFQIEEFDQIGTINGVPAAEYNLDSLEDKPWRKPGADITDYFNYGFNEDTWRAYCERQKRMRMTESGVGLQVQMTSIARAGPPPGRRMTGPIDVIGGVGGLGGVNAAQRMAAAPMGGKPEPPKMNVIQVMTADRREYSRKPTGFPDMTVPPPVFVEEFQPEYGFNPEPEPFYGGYEPTQEAQWGAENEAPPPINWAPTDIKSLTPGPAPPVVVGPPGPPVPPIHMGPPPMTLPMPVPSPRPQSPPPKRSESKERERTRDREVSRARSERPKDRDREKSHRRERSRSKSRRHKSRSRSPSHRSHKKKKSRRHEESD